LRLHGSCLVLLTSENTSSTAYCDDIEPDGAMHA
jgi:hypothetical protein